MFLADTGNVVIEYEDKNKKKIIFKGIIQEEVTDYIDEAEDEAQTQVSNTSKGKKKDKNFALRLEETDFLFLEKMAEEEERSVNYIICKAIKDYIKSNL